jgi:hypothetical protein
LAKNPEERPPTAEDLEDALGRCSSAGTWTLQEAEEWWRVSAVSFEVVPTTAMPEKTLVIEARN